MTDFPYLLAIVFASVWLTATGAAFLQAKVIALRLGQLKVSEQAPPKTTAFIMWGVRAFTAFLFCTGLLVHPITNRLFFGGIEKQNVAKLIACNDQSTDVLIQNCGQPFKRDTSIANGLAQIWSYQPAPWYLFWPKHEQVDVLIQAGYVIQVGDQPGRSAAPAQWPTEAEFDAQTPSISPAATTESNSADTPTGEWSD